MIMGWSRPKMALWCAKSWDTPNIPRECAQSLNKFNRDHLNPYINFHRPCFFPVSVIDRRGKIKKTYPYEEVRTPYEKLKSLPKAEKYLRRGVTFGALDAIAYQMSDNEASPSKLVLTSFS